MAKEYDKFKERLSKIEKAAKAYSPSIQEKMVASIKDLESSAAVGDFNIREAMAKAGREGVTENSVAAMMKNKHVKDAVLALNTLANMIDKEVQAVKVYSDGAAELIEMIKKLYLDIDKDLKSRKDSSATKKDIDAMQKDLQKLVNGLADESVAHSNLKPAYVDLGKNLPKRIEKLLTQKDVDNEKLLKETELTYLAGQRKVAKDLSTAKAYKMLVDEECDLAEKAAAVDVAKSAPHLKKAGSAVTASAKLATESKLYFKENETAILKGKNGAKIQEMVEDMTKFTQSADARLKKAMQTVKSLVKPN